MPKMEGKRLELLTPALSERCANHLRHPSKTDAIGFEPIPTRVGAVCAAITPDT